MQLETEVFMMNSNQEYTRRLFLAMSRIDEVYYALAKSNGVKENVLVLLYVLRDGTPRTQKQICEEWLIPKTTINTAVRECVGAGYLSCIASEDGREKRLVLTDAGKKYAEKILSPVETIEAVVIEKTLHQFSPEFIRALELYADSLKEETDKLLLQDCK